jgi:plastocyanin
MRSKLTLLTLTAWLTVTLAACGDDSAGGDEASPARVDLSSATFEDMTGQPVVTIEAVDNRFTPRYVEISAGTEVTFTNRGRNKHDVVPVDPEAFDEIAVEDFPPVADAAVPIRPDTTFDEPGDVPYYCTLHATPTKGMTGAIRVVDG